MTTTKIGAEITTCNNLACFANNLVCFCRAQNGTEKKIVKFNTGTVKNATKLVKCSPLLVRCTKFLVSFGKSENLELNAQ